MDSDHRRQKMISAEGFDQNAEGLKWGDDNTIWFISDWHATDEIYSLDIPTGKNHQTYRWSYTIILP